MDICRTLVDIPAGMVLVRDGSIIRPAATDEPPMGIALKPIRSGATVDMDTGSPMMHSELERYLEEAQ